MFGELELPSHPSGICEENAHLGEALWGGWWKSPCPGLTGWMGCCHITSPAAWCEGEKDAGRWDTWRQDAQRCQLVGLGRGGCFGRGSGLFDRAETTQWLVVLRVSLEWRGVSRYTVFARLCSGLMWSH